MYFIKFMKRAGLNTLVGRCWPMGHMFDTHVLGHLQTSVSFWQARHQDMVFNIRID